MGVFIYKTKGSFPNNFIMEAIDVLLMSKGEPAEVGIDTVNSYHGKNLISDLCDRDYEEYSRAIIHSHCNMGTTFSGTDTQQIKQWASTAPYYLSVVVNNRLEFNAKVAIKSTEEYKGFAYYKNLNNKQIKTSKTFTQESYELIDVEVIKEVPDYIIEINDRMKNIQQYSSRPVTTGYSSPSVYNSNITYTNKFADAWDKTTQFTTPVIKAPKQMELFGDGIDNMFIRKALQTYAYEGGQLMSPDEIAGTIYMDEEAYGIDESLYIKYLQENVFIDDKTDLKIIEELNSFINS